MRNIDAAQEFEKQLTWFCGGGITGLLRLKVVAGDIVHLKKEEDLSLMGGSEKRADIPLRMCAEFIRQIGMMENFYGEIIIDIRYGGIIEIEARRKYRIKDVKKYLSREEQANGSQTIAQY